MKQLYIVKDKENTLFIYKFLSKVEEKTYIESKTLSKHFSRTNKPYKKNGFTIEKCYNIDLKSFNRGNEDNFKTY